jgi:hypothetical protein
MRAFFAKKTQKRLDGCRGIAGEFGGRDTGGVARREIVGCEIFNRTVLSCATLAEIELEIVTLGRVRPHFWAEKCAS